MKHERTLIEHFGAIAAVILVMLGAFVIDSWVIGSIEGGFSQDPLMHALANVGIFIGGAALGLLMVMKLFGTPNKEQEEILTYGFAAEIVLMIINAGLALSKTIGVSSELLPWARVVLIAGNIVVGMAIVVMYFKKDSHAELRRLQHENDVENKKATLKTDLAVTQANSDAQQSQATLFNDLYKKAMNAPQIYQIMEYAAQQTALQFASRISGLHLAQDFSIAKPNQQPPAIAAASPRVLNQTAPGVPLPAGPQTDEQAIENLTRAIEPSGWMRALEAYRTHRQSGKSPSEAQAETLRETQDPKA